MNISFNNTKSQKIAESEKKMRKEFGSDIGKKIMQRLGEIDAADTLNDMPKNAERHPLQDSYDGCYGIKLNHNFRMIIKPIGEFDPLDLKTITDIEIVILSEDYH